MYKLKLQQMSKQRERKKKKLLTLAQISCRLQRQRKCWELQLRHDLLPLELPASSQTMAASDFLRQDSTTSDQDYKNKTILMFQ